MIVNSYCLAKPEVRDLHLPYPMGWPCFDEDVGRFEVSVDESVAVHTFETSEDLRADRLRIFLGYSAMVEGGVTACLPGESISWL